MIQTSEARELCSKSEWELVESSFFPMVETLPRSGLKSRLERARKLYGKTTDLVSRLDHSNIVHQAHERRRQTHVTIPVGGMGLPAAIASKGAVTELSLSSTKAIISLARRIAVRFVTGALYECKDSLRPVEEPIEFSHRDIPN